MTSSIDGARMHPQLKRSFILEHAVHLPDHAILSLVVKDPRDLPKEGPKLCPEAASYMLDADVVKGDYSGHSASIACSDQYKEIISSSWLNSDNVLYSDSKDLWENHNNMNPPLDENLLCMEKHHKRMDFFHINKNIEITSTEIAEQSSRSCPVILLKESNLPRAGVRYACKSMIFFYHRNDDIPVAYSVCGYCISDEIYLSCSPSLYPMTLLFSSIN